MAKYRKVVCWHHEIDFTNTVIPCLLVAITVFCCIMEAILLGQCGCHTKSARCVPLSEEGEASAGDSLLPGFSHLYGATTEPRDVFLLLPHYTNCTLSQLMRLLLGTWQSLELCIFTFSSSLLVWAVLLLHYHGVLV